MLQIHQFAPVDNIQFSPFCLKVEVYCQLTGIPFLSVATMPNKSPTGKLPFIIDDKNIIADSGRIIDYLKQTRGDPLDGLLDDRQHALGHLIRRTCEENLIFSILYSRWLDEENWPKFRDLIFCDLPFFLKPIIPALLRKKIQKSIYSRGLKSNVRDIIYQSGIADLKALSVFIKKNSFAVTDKATSYDATVFAFLSTFTDSRLKSPLGDYVSGSDELRDYIIRMQDLISADHEKPLG